MVRPNKRLPYSPLDLITRSALAGVALVGFAVIAGWHLRVRVLVQVFSGVIPMQYNTALCFIALAVSGWLLITRRSHWLGPVIGGAFAAMMGALVLFEYATGKSIGIDTLFFYPWLRTLSADPGRMALTSAISFLSSGLAIILLSLRRSAVATFAILHTLPVSLGLTSAMGYLVGITLVLPFHLGSQMAVHTAFAFLGYGSVMLTYAWQQTPRTGTPRWVSAIGVLIVPILFVGVSISAQRTSAFGSTVLMIMGLLAAGLFAMATRRMNDSSVNRKGLILISVPLVFLFVFVLFVTQLSRKSEQAEAASLQAKEIIATIELISTDLFEAESSIHGYVITGDPRFEQSFDLPRQEVPLEVDRLQNLVKDNPEQKARAVELREKVAERLSLQDRLKQLVKDGDKEGASKLISTGAGLRLMNDIRRTTEEFLKEEQRLDAERRHTADNTLHGFNWLLVAGSSIDLFLAVILAILFSTGISKRIVALTENAKALAKGEKLADPIQGADEIAHLDQVFREMAEALQEAARKERAIFENALDIICSTDGEGRFLKMSPSSLKIWGYRPEEMVGRHFTEFLVPEEIEKSTEASQEVVSNKTLTNFENRYRCKDGSIVNMLWSAWWSETDQVVFAMARDITERKLAEEALLESEARYRLLFESNPHPIWVYDLETLAFLAVNRAAILNYGYSREEFLAMTLKDIRPDEDLPALLENVSSLPPGVHAGTWKHRKKSGEIIDVEITSHELTFVGRAARVVLANDVTERKRAEAAISKLNVDLEKRSAQLEQANKELEAFSYSVSHDLRAPLRAIDGFSRILVEEHAGKLDEDATRVLGVIRSNTQNMGRLIDDLLAFSRLGRKPIEQTKIDMEELARDVCTRLSAADSAPPPQFDLGPLHEAQGDPAMVRQVFVNLLSNAAKYSKAKTPARIEVGGYRENGENIYYVKDNGVGFDMNYANKLFGVFQRLHSAEEFEGTGVGLAIVQRIIHRHGGRVWADGKVNEGATFYFTLPKEQENNGKPPKHE